ncbi:MAG TPA: hypothetical protein VGR78_02720 [Verrucomicrobiae bacterium]|jgi:hypothetical protein|nr:hypothetical protein [Verrucomicrobiae bacterium]
MNQKQHHKQLDGSALEERLRSEKPVLTAPAGFTDKVIAELPHRIRRAADPTSAPRTSLWPRIAFAVAALVLSAIIFPRFRNIPEPVASPRTSPAETLAGQIAMPKVTSEQLDTLAVKLDQPLEKELHNMVSDTRQAIQFVAANFLPAK